MMCLPYYLTTIFFEMIDTFFTISGIGETLTLGETHLARGLAPGKKNVLTKSFLLLL